MNSNVNKGRTVNKFSRVKEVCAAARKVINVRNKKYKSASGKLKTFNSY